MKFDFTDIMTTAEASKRWNISLNTIKSACLGQKGYPPRFSPDECRKSESAWLVTRQGMERLYGKEKTE